MKQPVDFYVGLDIAQQQDFTAIAIIEEPVWVGSHRDYWQVTTTTDPGWHSPVTLAETQTLQARTLACKHG